MIGRPIAKQGEIVRARRPVRLPVVKSRDEVSAVLTYLKGDKWPAASLMYGAGLRLTECLQLRVQDVSFASGELFIRDGKDRVTMLPESLKIALQEHLKRVMAIHERDLAKAGAAS